MNKIITRFAPSPTGFFHIGSARTALFNYLFSKKNNGTLILRIEDTDKERSKPEFEQDIIENLEWLNIKYDILYRQSERTGVYKRYLKKLLDDKKAYYCFCSEEELEAKKQDQISRGLAFKYNGKCSKLSQKEIEKKLASKENYVIRFKTPFQKIKFNDMVRGRVEFDAKLIGDFSIARDIESPLYNFSVVVDDFEMKINHVIRGEDLLPNTPKQILLQKALKFSQPQYAHLPLILGPDKSKLSKRHGAVSVADYRKQGYLTETLINFLAFLGWNPGTEREIYSLAALVKDFSMEKVQKSGAIFNIKKLDSLNGFYIRQKSAKKLTELCIPYLIGNKLIKPVFKSQEKLPNLTGIMGKEIVQKYIAVETKEEVSLDYLERIISINQERMKKLPDIVDLSSFFFKKKPKYERNLLKWKGTGDKELKLILNKLEKILSDIKDKDWNRNNLEKVLIPEAEQTAKELNREGDRGYLLWTLRAALTGKKSSASPFEIAEILGKEKTIKRIK
jgi:glutamyl-tRNA synthetase